MTEEIEDKDENQLPVEGEKEVGALKAEIAALQKQNEDYLDSLQRERASFANYKRRIDLDNASFAERLLAEHVKFFLPVVDDLERSLQHRPEDPDCAGWIAGVELILQKLLKSLEAKDVHPLDLKPGDNVAEPAGIPVVCGEEGPVSGCGVAALSISYYDIGFATGEMAYEILVNGADISTMEVQFASETIYKYLPERAAALGVNIPAHYVAIA